MTRFPSLALIILLGYISAARGQEHQPQQAGLGRSVIHRTHVADIALSPRGSLSGVVVSTAGKPLGGLSVSLRPAGLQYSGDARGNEPAAPRAATTITSGANGNFELAVPKPGVYVLQAGNHTTLVRIWQPAAAPPSARSQLLVVAEGATYRGQPGSRLAEIFRANGNIIAGTLLAAGIATPIILEAQSDDGS